MYKALLPVWNLPLKERRMSPDKAEGEKALKEYERMVSCGWNKRI
jgi:hypothetical protein